jgi:hypothetical protein
MIAELRALIRPPVSPDGHAAHPFKIVRAGMPTLYYIECGCGRFKTPQSLHKRTAQAHWRDHARAALTTGVDQRTAA